MKSIIVIGAGMGGFATGIYGQINGFRTEIFESHGLPGGQCTSWNRKGYVFDACIHYWGAGSGFTKVDAFWREMGAQPCEMVPTNECVSALFPDGTWVHDYHDLGKLEAHLKGLSPEDSGPIDDYLHGIRLFLKRPDPIGDMMFGSTREKLASLPLFLGLIKYIRTSLGSFATRFKHPLLRRFFPLLHSSIPEVPVFLQISKHGYSQKGDLGWPRGGSLAVSKNIAARYESLGGSIHYGKKVAKILTEGSRACGVELEDGTRHMADYVVSNADGRKTIMRLLEGRYVDDRILKYCRPNPDIDRPWAVTVYLGVKRDLSALPSALLLFLDKEESICGHVYDHLDMQIYGFDADMAPEGKGVIKVELFAKASYFSALYGDEAGYRAEKEGVADQVISLLDAHFPGLRADVEVVDVVTLRTWERYMGGTEGCDNFPNKSAGINVFKSLLGLDDSRRLPGLKGFYLVGGWVTSAGALLFNAISGKTIIRRICKEEGRKFSASRGIAQT